MAIGGALASRFHPSEALEWYRKTAVQGNVEGEYQVGHMLLFGAHGIPNNLSVSPNQTEGTRWMFMAATNYPARACWNMGKAMRQGLGASTNLIAAYAWLSLFANTPPGFIVDRSQISVAANGLLHKVGAPTDQSLLGIWRSY